jgi:hypothetical protein
MKAYRLAAWPQLQARFDKVACRRMLSNMSHRRTTLTQLVECSWIRRHDVRRFIDMLECRGLLAGREATDPDSLFGSLRPSGGWLKRTLAGTQADSR